MFLTIWFRQIFQSPTFLELHFFDEDYCTVKTKGGFDIHMVKKLVY